MTIEEVKVAVDEGNVDKVIAEIAKLDRIDFDSLNGVITSLKDKEIVYGLATVAIDGFKKLDESEKTAANKEAILDVLRSAGTDDKKFKGYEIEYFDKALAKCLPAVEQVKVAVDKVIAEIAKLDRIDFDSLNGVITSLKDKEIVDGLATVAIDGFKKLDESEKTAANKEAILDVLRSAGTDDKKFKGYEIEYFDKALAKYLPAVERADGNVQRF